MLTFLISLFVLCTGASFILGIILGWCTLVAATKEDKEK